MKFGSTTRQRTPITESDLQVDPDEVMQVLIKKKNDNQTWRMIANDLSANLTESISPALARKVALGYCKSQKIEAALGLCEEMVTVPLSQVKTKRNTKTGRGKRTRLNIDTTPAVIARFDTQRGDMGRGEYLERLLDLEFKC